MQQLQGKEKMISEKRTKNLTDLCASKGDVFLALDTSEGKARETICFIREGVEIKQRLTSYRQGLRPRQLNTDAERYVQRSANQRKRYLERLEALCTSRGDLFICLDTEHDSAHSYAIYFERDGAVEVQNVHSYKRGLKLQRVYLEEVKRYPEGQGLYKFYSGEELVYIGKTKNFNLRFQGHFKVYANPEYYKSTISRNNSLIDKIEICELGEADMHIYEMYLIAKHKPRFNDKDVPQDEPSFELPTLNFTEITGWR